MTVIHVGDIGTVFRVTIVEADGVTVVPVNTATKKYIHFQKGDGALVTKNASFYTDGRDGVIQYTSQAGDVSSSGNWFMQGYVELPDGKFFSEVVGFIVHDTIAPSA